MQKRIDICDRCNREYSNSNIVPLLLFKRRIRTIKLTKIFSPDPYDYVEDRLDLCPECAKELERWLKNDERHIDSVS